MANKSLSNEAKEIRIRNPNLKELVADGLATHPQVAFRELWQEDREVPRAPREEVVKNINTSSKIRAWRDQVFD